MMKTFIASGIVLGALAAPTFAATTAATFYVAQDAKTHACSVTDKKPDGKMMMDAGTKTYASQANAQQALTNLKVCAASAMAAPAKAPAAVPAKPAATTTAAAATGFYVGQDAKTHKCAVSNEKPDGKMMMDVGTKMYDTQGHASDAMSKLTACKA
ncbi:hypothetical protein [Aestuariivirga litoralis]|uniref:hypothetical protein n=1 Tax=Aestuariivirga litoralis TaxID=2650924 RepID=UPI0018C66DBE|nr:hypothetical protein [Aestuariivirga litoralis]